MMPKGSGIQFVEELFPIVFEPLLGKGLFLMLSGIFTPLIQGCCCALRQSMTQALHVGSVADPTIFLMVHKLWHASPWEDNAGNSSAFGFDNDKTERLLIQGRGDVKVRPIVVRCGVWDSSGEGHETGKAKRLNQDVHFLLKV